MPLPVCEAVTPPSARLKIMRDHWYQQADTKAEAGLSFAYTSYSSIACNLHGNGA
jgi:hypothetical protein